MTVTPSPTTTTLSASPSLTSASSHSARAGMVSAGTVYVSPPARSNRSVGSPPKRTGVPETAAVQESSNENVVAMPRSAFVSTTFVTDRPLYA